MLCYTGNVQTFTAPSATTYKLEVWGAQSGKHFQNGVLENNLYGRGGYSLGNYSMNNNQTIYIAIGGKGEDGKYQTRVSGGWNGGGDGEWDHNDNEAMSGGGGCTSLQRSLRGDGQLKHYESVKNTDVLIVAGGGGGQGLSYNETWAGGEVGSIAFYYLNGKRTNGGQATQTSGYSFGQGQSAPSTIKRNSEVPGGGGGWYGGYTIIPTAENTYANAGGGSGHIGTMLTNGATIAGNQSFPSPTGGTETGHSGNGYCKITWMPAL